MTEPNGYRGPRGITIGKAAPYPTSCVLKKEKKISLHIGEIGGFDEEAYHGSETIANRRKRRIARDQKEAKENPPDISREIKNLKRIQRSEEFGGMNTGETEWTEPRDTANSRVKRGKDVA